MILLFFSGVPHSSTANPLWSVAGLQNTKYKPPPQAAFSALPLRPPS